MMLAQPTVDQEDGLRIAVEQVKHGIPFQAGGIVSGRRVNDEIGWIIARDG